MKEVPFEKWGELMNRARKLGSEVLVPVYMTAAFMAEAGVSPAEVVAYLEEHFMEA